jgi:ATP-dependent DNA helicase RecG
LANALCHRDYSSGGGSVSLAIYQDRLEITSTGNLHFGLTPEQLFQPHESRPWNPLIARVFHRRGIIESWGRGTLKMAELTQQAGLPRPEIEEGPDLVLVRFRPSRYIPPQQVRQDLTERQRKILQLLSERPGIGRKKIQQALQLDVNELKSDLQRLRGLGLIRQTGKGRGTVLFLAEG